MEELFTPHTVINRYTARKGISVEEVGVAPIVVVSWGRAVIESLAAKIQAQPAEHWLYADRHPFFLGEVQKQAVSLAHLPVGAPGSVMMIEEMIACGACVVIGLGWAGSLQPSAPIGSFLIPTACIREEGTSAHYVDGDTSIAPDAALANGLEAAARAEDVIVHKGRLWTTDAPYRELRSKVQEFRQQGVLGVDMETSAMYALGQYREVKICNLLVISDELGEEWRPAFGTPELQAATKKAEDVIMRYLATQSLESDYVAS